MPWSTAGGVDRRRQRPGNGSGGFDYMLSAATSCLASPKAVIRWQRLPNRDSLKPAFGGWDREGYGVLAEADTEVKVSVDDNTITLSGEIPGITGGIAAQVQGV